LHGQGRTVRTSKNAQGMLAIHCRTHAYLLLLASPQKRAHCPNLYSFSSSELPGARAHYKMPMLGACDACRCDVCRAPTGSMDPGSARCVMLQNMPSIVFCDSGVELNGTFSGFHPWLTALLHPKNSHPSERKVHSMNTPPKVHHQNSIVHENANMLLYSRMVTHTNTYQHAASANRQAVRPASPPLQRQQANMHARTERMSCVLLPTFAPEPADRSCWGERCCLAHQGAARTAKWWHTGCCMRTPWATVVLKKNTGRVHERPCACQGPEAPPSIPMRTQHQTALSPL
jgi:hypothetical protein